MKITHVLLAILFFVFAGFQFNDPDPWIWIALYGYVGVMFVLAAMGRGHKYLLYLGIAACLVEMGLTLPGVMDYLTNQDGMTIMEGMSNDKPYIELTREFGGALIALAALAWLAWKERKA